MDIQHEELAIIKSQLIAEVFCVLAKHAGGSFSVMKEKPEYIVLFNLVCSGIEQGIKEVDPQWEN